MKSVQSRQEVDIRHLTEHTAGCPARSCCAGVSFRSVSAI